jgi:F0F1-type ATP synthase membrane subunit a
MRYGGIVRTKTDSNGSQKKRFQQMVSIMVNRVHAAVERKRKQKRNHFVPLPVLFMVTSFSANSCEVGDLMFSRMT